jgi:ABC-type multidrug transport system fused ATPase/permease subunit/CRP-like cAMP-binding protein
VPVISGDAPILDRHRYGAPGTVLAVLAPSLRRQRGALTVTIGLVVVAVALGAAVPRFVKELLYHDTPTLIVLFVLVLAADPVANHLAHLRAARVSLRAGYDLRTRVFAGVRTTHPGDVDARVRANATANTGADVDRVEHAFESLLIGGLAGVLRIVAALSFLALINVAAAVLMLCVMPVFFLAQRRLAGRLVAADHARQASADQVATVVDESVTAVSSARGLALGGWFGRRLAKEAHHLDELSYEQLRLDARLHLATRIVALVGLAAVTMLGVWDEGSAGDLLAALLYIELAIMGLESLPAMLRALQQGEASCARLETLLDADPTEMVVADGPSSNAAGLTLTDPQGVRHDVSPGAWVVVVDGSGADPVTWLGGLREPASGTVAVDGLPATLAVKALRLAAIASDAGCVDASVMDHLHAVAPSLDREGAMSLLERLGIGHLAEMRGGGLDAPLGVQGALLSTGERQRLLLAMSLAAEPGVLVVGQVRPLADPDVARPVIAELRRSGATLLMTSETESIAADADNVLFLTADRWHLAPHHDLLMTVPAYVERWNHGSRETMAFGALTAAGPLEREALQNRMITERYEPGDTIYREGAPADRVVFVVSGRVEITTGAGTANERRLAVVQPGNACGDLRLTTDERRAETARAIDLVVVRTIGRAVWEAGMGGLLRADPAERRVLASILRRGALTLDELIAHLPDDDASTVSATVSALLRDGALRQRASGELTIGASKRRATTSSAAGSLLDQLAEG